MNEPRAALWIGCLLVSIASTTGCGSRTALDDDTDGGEPSTICPPAVLLRRVVIRGDEFVSSLEGLDSEGSLHRVECELVPGPRPRAFGGCRWLTAGALVCTCDEPDWGMPSPRGVPLCTGWNRRFDFSDVVFEP